MKPIPANALLFLVSILILSTQPTAAQNIGIFDGHSDVGTNIKPGSATYIPATGQYVISGAGYNVWADHGEFQYVYKKIKGDFILYTRAEFLGTWVGYHRKVGWMVRQSLAGNSPHINAVEHGDGLTSLQFRPAAGAQTQEHKFKLTYANILQLERKGNYCGLKPKEILQLTKDLGMTLRSGHIHVDNDWKKSLEEATETGQQYIISAVLPSQGQTVDHYKQSAETFNQMGSACNKVGLHFGYHNHDSKFDTVDGTVLYDVLLKYTDPALVTMETDLGWVVAAGHDPFHYFSTYPGGFPLWHLKDVDKVRKQRTEFGQGQVDIKGLLQHAKQAGMKHFFLEQEEYAHSAFESIRIDYDYLAKLDY